MQICLEARFKSLKMLRAERNVLLSKIVGRDIEVLTDLGRGEGEFVLATIDRMIKELKEKPAADEVGVNQV